MRRLYAEIGIKDIH